MARASNIYIVHLNGEPDTILAAFTVKYESQDWAEQHYSLDEVQRYRLRDAGNWHVDAANEKLPCPWKKSGCPT